MRTGRKFTYRPSFFRSATLMLWWPPAIGVAVGPLSPTRVHSSDARTSSGSNCPVSASAAAPASTLSHSIATPVASTARTVASATSGPIPSPGIRVIWRAILAIIAARGKMIPDWRSERQRMVDRQLRKRGIRDGRVLEAMLTIPREEFVPVEPRVCSFRDEPVQIGYGQTISQPYMIALMAELLELTGAETVLEVGCGSGYHAAVLGMLAARVISIELIPALARQAEQNLLRTGRAANIQVVCGDGSQGWPEGAPGALYDAISVAAGGPALSA